MPFPSVSGIITLASALLVTKNGFYIRIITSMNLLIPKMALLPNTFF
jgi:hypothetical protein